ncbi:MAG: hypothetical protein ACNA77_01885 [Opitutales bacterium]
MKKILFLLSLIAFSCAASLADDAVEVNRVKFNSAGQNWIQMEIELRCLANPSPDARNSRFVENIKVKVYLAWERDSQARLFDYYTSEVEIVIMEQNDKNNVYFYLPGPIVDRDRLRRDPDFYYVEVSVNGEPQLPRGGSAVMSRSISTLEILNSFIANANSGSLDNEHLLMPVYLVSDINLGRVSNLPVFLRRDVRQ